MHIPQPGRQAMTCLIFLLSLALCAYAGRISGESTTVSTASLPADDQLRSFLSSYGWEVAGDPVTDQVVLPESFGPSYESYLACQHECGFSLEDYAGETVDRYTYTISNYPTGETAVFADLLIFQGEVIGGDIRSADLDGFMHSLRYPEYPT